MLTITVPGIELFDEEKNEFDTIGDVVLELEHSLVSLSKWESIWEKPFLGPSEKSPDEVLSYINMMIVTPDFPPDILHRFSQENLNEIRAYIDAKRSATWFSNLSNEKPSRETITSELIYYWMVTANIPFECETWHLNRLFNLIKVYTAKNSKPRKMSQEEIKQRNRELNAKRKAELNTTG